MFNASLFAPTLKNISKLRAIIKNRMMTFQQVYEGKHQNCSFDTMVSTKHKPHTSKNKNKKNAM